MGLFDIFSNDDAEAAAQARIDGLRAAYNRATSALNTGLDSANNYYGRALVPFTTLFNQGQGGINAYSDALGLNGAEGNARARAAFANNPGYQAQLDTGLQAIDRGAAARGMLSSGNTLAAEQKYGSDLTNQSWNQYLSSFSPFMTLAGQGASGIGNVNTAQAGTNYGAGQDLAKYGWQMESGIGDANAAAQLANYNASQNMWGALMSGAQLGAKLLPFIPSDARLKEDIVRVGTLTSGLPLYRFRFKGGKTQHVGVLAQDVERLDPPAVREIAGIKMVNYARVVSTAAKTPER